MWLKHPMGMGECRKYQGKVGGGLAAASHAVNERAVLLLHVQRKLLAMLWLHLA